MNRYAIFIWSYLFVLVFSLNPAFGEELEAVRAVLEQTSRQLTDATLKGDGETMLSFYSDDAISLPNYSPMLRGKEAIRTHGQQMEEMGFQFKAIDFRTSDLWTCGDLVYELGNYDISFCIGDTMEIIDDHGKYMTVWEMQSDGGLKIKIETWNTNLWPCGSGN
jgi:ketosteroid isomerase-like protein